MNLLFGNDHIEKFLKIVHPCCYHSLFHVFSTLLTMKKNLVNIICQICLCNNLNVGRFEIQLLYIFQNGYKFI